MAVLGEIRRRPWVIMVVIGVALLAFVAGDLFSENSAIRKIFAGDPNIVGSINGEDIGIGEYQNAVNLTTNMMQNQGQNITPNQAAQQTWNNLVSTKLIQQIAEKIGLKVSDNEFWDFVAQNFGMASGDEARNQVAQLEQMAATDPNALQQYEGWLSTANSIRAQLLNQKYTSYVTAGAFATSKEADIQQTYNAETATIDFAYLDYESLAKKLNIKVSDEDINAYVKKYPKQFEVEPMVKLAYTYFPAKASASDEQVALKNINAYLATQIKTDQENGITDTIVGFAQAKNDSAYIAQNSDDAFISQYFTKDQIKSFGLPAEAQNFLNGAQVGQVGGPFKIQNTYQLYKLSKAKDVRDSVKSSHILVAYKGSPAGQNITRSKEEAKKLADHYLAEAKTGNFGALAEKYSDDKGSATQKGSIGWVGQQNGLTPVYSQFIFNKPVGTIDIVESEFGYHIIKVDEAKSKTAYQVAHLVKRIKPSKATTDKAFTDARSYVQSVNGKSLNVFTDLAKKKGYVTNKTQGLERFAPTIGQDIPNDQDDAILGWAFNKKTNKGDTNLFTTNYGDYIVVHVEDKFGAGLAAVSVAREIVEPIVRRQIITAKVNETIGNGGLNAFVSKLGATKFSENINFANANISTGIEPRVAGVAFGIKENTSSKAIEGNAGVYYVITKSKIKPQNQNGSQLLDNMTRSLKNRIQQNLLPSLIEAADIKDNRSRVMSR
ncbi:peptidylprolyl isomerase [Vaginella massiliensis]|uniref:peptidylprolyl isomerase n=1 Tax=Vaginella massiliensis TaxID=1816680 RepID=UPI00083969F0|nr:peptidylprolyl isomerase [Vaginella massiliensis]